VLRREIGTLTNMKRRLEAQLRRAVAAGDSQAARDIADRIKSVADEIAEGFTSLVETIREKVKAELQEALDRAQMFADRAANFASAIQQMFRNLEISQKLKGTYDTAAGQKERQDYINQRIVPALFLQYAELQKAYGRAVKAGDTTAAQQLQLAMLQIIGDIGQAQLDAQEQIADSTSETADNTADNSALLAALEEKLRIANETIRIQRGAFDVFQGPGDINTGGRYALDVAKGRETGTPGPGLGLSYDAQGNLVGDGGTTVIVNANSLVPADTASLLAIGEAASKGFSLQGARVSPREQVSL
jgi:hypothetical protein